MLEIRQATTETDFKNIGHFYDAFIAWLKQTYPEFMPLFLRYEVKLKSVVASFPGEYEPPTGGVLLAVYNGEPAGTISWADLGQNCCEMRRLFVDPQFRGAKIGHALTEATLKGAREQGYEKMSLRTGPRHFAALSLYQKWGFTLLQKPLNPRHSRDHLSEDLRGGEMIMELVL